jgi:hypothetical protein
MQDDGPRLALDDGHFIASSTTCVCSVVAIAQPTMRRLQTSSTTARYKKPAHVGTYVMSATQSLSGPLAVKSRRTRSADGVASGCRTVVRFGFRGGMPTSARRQVDPCIDDNYISPSVSVR